jgi:Spy/CpxP family protein refolding chaperone
LVRTQLQLTEKQADKLRRLAERNRISQAEVMRRMLDRENETEALPDWEELKRRALACAGIAHSDVTDLSTRHDDYFAEAAME